MSSPSQTTKSFFSLELSIFVTVPVTVKKLGGPGAALGLYLNCLETLSPTWEQKEGRRGMEREKGQTFALVQRY